MKKQEYHKVYNNIKSEILGGHYAAGQKLPSERQLCQTYKVSRITTRHALRLLEDDSLVERFQGKGTFVKKIKPAKLPITDSGFAKSVRQFAPDLYRNLAKQTFITPPVEIAKLLHLNGNQCLLAIRTDVLNDEILAFDKAYINSQYCSTITPELLIQVDFLEAWTKQENLTIAYYHETVEAIIADEETALILQTKKGQVILKATEIYHDVNNVPLAAFESYYRGDRIKLSSIVNLKDKNHVKVSD